MLPFAEYQQYDGIGLAELVTSGQVSATQLCEAAIARAEQTNPAINAIITPLYDLARQVAARPLPPGPFHGVPFLLKDLLFRYANVPTTHGSELLRHYIAKQDSEIVRRFKASGLNILGTTNTPEFGLMAITEPQAYGPTRNPWNLAHSAGGSSGGSAAAIAAGIVPIAAAGDGGGSIRIPAACCGLFGLKPSRGRTPNGPEHGELWDGATVLHVLSRSVRDSAAMLDVVMGPEAGTTVPIAPPEQPYLTMIQTPPRALRIGMSVDSPLHSKVDRACIEAVEHTAQLLTSLGHHVEYAAPQYDGLALAEAYMTMTYGHTAALVKLLISIFGKRAVRDKVELTTRTLALIGNSVSAAEFVTQKHAWHQFAMASAKFHTQYDLFLTPTLGTLPVQIGALQPSRWDQAGMQIVNALNLGKLLRTTGLVRKLALQSLSKTPFTQLANLTGQPAMSVPLYWSDNGLPCGSHFMARVGDEATLLKLAYQLEQAQPWLDRHPPMQ